MENTMKKIYSGNVVEGPYTDTPFELKIYGVKDISIVCDSIQELNDAQFEIERAILNKLPCVKVKNYLIVVNHICYVMGNKNV